MKVIPRGRYKFDKNGLKFFNPGSGISFGAKARHIFVNVMSEKKPAFVYLIKDFNYEKKEKILVADTRKIDIFFDDDKVHFVDLVKANEAADNFIIIGPVFSNGYLIDIDEKDKKFVQVYGDSSIAGYGILSHDGIADFDTNDGVENFCFRALYSLGFDYDIFAASGWGITFSAYTDPKTVGIEKFQDKITINSKEKWNGKTPDFLIISLGTNDMSFILENPQNSQELMEKFIKSYENLIKKEREKNPQIPVLMVYGSLKEEFVYNLIEKTYQEVSKKLGNIHIIKLDGDNSAISFHSYVSYHKEMAEDLKKKIVQILS